MPRSSRPQRRLLPLLIRLACLGVVAAGASAKAAEASAADQEAILPTIVATGQAERDAYAVQRASSATKTDTALRDLPQSVTVITRALIRDQAMQSMADVTRYVPGVGMANGEGNRDSPVFRGSASASGDFYIDGVRDDVEYYRDLYNVERVDALVGPNAMIFGRGGSGGVINRVSKLAGWTPLREADLTVGSYRNRRLVLDVDQPINPSLAVRVAALDEDSGGFQRKAALRRSGINPTLAIRVGQDSSVVLGYEHFEDRRTADRGVPSMHGRPLDLDVAAFFGDPDPAARPIALRSDAVFAVLDHEFGGGVHLSDKLRYTDYDKFYQNYNAGVLNLAAGQVAMSAYNNHAWRKNLFNQTDVSMELDAGAFKHTLLAGLELGTQDTDYLRKTGVFANGATSINVPLARPDGPLPVNFVLGGSSSDRDGSSSARIAGLYAQDQVSLTPQWQVIAGLRIDSFTLHYHNNRAGGLLALPVAPADLSSSDHPVSPRLGLLYKPVTAATLYANYSVATFPRGGDQLSSLNNVNQGLKPEQFVNYELGAKWDLNADLMATLALYRLKRNNVAVVNPATGIADQLVDGQRSEGLELGLGGKLSAQWSVRGGYAYQDARLLASASATALSGATVGMVPRHAISLWNRYDFTPSLGAGLGVSARDDMFASTSNAVVLPKYARVDAALFYTVNAKLKLQLNVENLFDRKYYASANGDNNITPGSPRALRFGLHAAL